MADISRYWADRQIEANLLKDKQLADEVNKRLAVLRDNLQKEIESEFRRYADSQNIPIVEAKMKASNLDIEAYQRKAAQYVKSGDFSAQANYEMKLYNLTMRVSRLELLKANLGLEMINTFNELDRFLRRELTADGYRDIERQASILGQTVFGDYKKIVEAIVNGDFYNATFSDRIWTYQAELKAELAKLLERQLVGGHNPRIIARELRQAFEVSQYQAERLIRTESARIQIELDKAVYKEYNVKKYEYVSEPTACKICKGLDGSIHNTSEMSIGSNAPPMHPNCRCTTAPISDREIRDLQY